MDTLIVFFSCLTTSTAVYIGFLQVVLVLHYVFHKLIPTSTINKISPDFDMIKFTMFSFVSGKTEFGSFWCLFFTRKNGSSRLSPQRHENVRIFRRIKKTFLQFLFLFSHRHKVREF